MNASIFYKTFRDNFNIEKSQLVRDAYQDDITLKPKEWTRFMR